VSRVVGVGVGGGAGGGGGMYEMGVPAEEISFRAPSPKEIMLATVVALVGGKLGVTPEETAVMYVRTDVYVVVVCRDAGQFITPEDRQVCAVNVAVDVSVALVREAVVSRRTQGNAVTPRPKMPCRKPPPEVVVGEATMVVVTDGEVMRVMQAEVRVV